MNERIDELAQEAAGGMLSYDEDGYRLSEREVKKFAELIVQDVIDILSVYRAKITFYDGVEHNCQHPITVIQKHFGVE